MISIGTKIKQLRDEKGLSQNNLHPNQSSVSQIEGGMNKNPSEQTLRIIADNLGISFEELIYETDWIPKYTGKRKSQYAISQTEAIVRIEKNGELIIRRKSYPLYNDLEEKNKYDPDTGIELLTECKKCKRIFEKPSQRFCLNCGQNLGKEFEYTDLLIYPYAPAPPPGVLSPFILKMDFHTNHESNRMVFERISKLLAERLDIQEELNDYYMSIGAVRDSDKLLRFLTEVDKLFINPGEEIDYGMGTVNSKKPHVRHWWISHMFKISCYKGLLNELNRLDLEIMQHSEGNSGEKSNQIDDEAEENISNENYNKDNHSTEED